MAANSSVDASKRKENPSLDIRLRKHADYQRVYREGKRQSLPLMTYFFAMRSDKGPPQAGPRIGLTAGRVLGNAVQRNRIKRRMREAVRRHRSELDTDVDVILHPRRAVLDADFSQIERDVVRAFRAVRGMAHTQEAPEQENPEDRSTNRQKVETGSGIPRPR